MLQTSKQGDLNVMSVLKTELIAAGAFPCTIHLYQNDFSPTRDSVPADFTEATFDGYASLALTFAIGPYLNAASQAEIQNASKNWTPSGSTTPNTIYGYYVTETGGDYMWGERFDIPRPMTGPTSSLTLLPILILVPGGLSGSVQVLDT